MWTLSIRQDTDDHDLTSSVEFDSLLQLNHFGNITLGFRISILFVGLVQCCDVGVVVFRMVQLHDLSTDNRFQCAVVVR